MLLQVQILERILMDRAKLKLEAKESYLYTTSVLYKLNIITEDQLKSYHEFCGVTNHKNSLIIKIQKSIPKVKCFRPSHDKLKKWEFHKGDADPNPSVPHGHKINDSNIKLDVYLGFIFKNQQIIWTFFTQNNFITCIRKYGFFYTL